MGINEMQKLRVFIYTITFHYFLFKNVNFVNNYLAIF